MRMRYAQLGQRGLVVKVGHGQKERLVAQNRVHKPRIPWGGERGQRRHEAHLARCYDLRPPALLRRRPHRPFGTAAGC